MPTTVSRGTAANQAPSAVSSTTGHGRVSPTGGVADAGSRPSATARARTVSIRAGGRSEVVSSDMVGLPGTVVLHQPQDPAHRPGQQAGGDQSDQEQRADGVAVEVVEQQARQAGHQQGDQ